MLIEVRENRKIESYIISIRYYSLIASPEGMTTYFANSQSFFPLTDADCPWFTQERIFFYVESKSHNLFVLGTIIIH